MNLPAVELNSQALGRSYQIWRYDPPGGGDGRLSVFLDGEFYLERVHALPIVQRLQAERRVPPRTTLFVSHIDATVRTSDYICQAGYNEFLAGELIPWAIENGVAEPGNHTLVGLSLSGLAALFAAWEHPETFSHVVSQSPSAWWNDNWLERYIALKPRPELKIWLSVGCAETETDVTHEPAGLFQRDSQLASCERLATRLEQQCRHVNFQRFDGSHEMHCWEQELPQALTWIDANPRDDP